MAHAIKDTGYSPQKIAEEVANKNIDLAKYTLSGKPDMKILQPFYDDMFKKIDESKKIRNHWLSQTEEKKTPLKYVIVATGNIYEDIKQAVSAAELGADIIAVIRSTGQSLLDFVPFGATTEGFGGTFATQENFRLMRKALDDVSKKMNRYVRLVNYASGLCMPEIATMGAIERLDMMLNDSLYGIIFRDINMKRTFIDQYFSRLLSAYSEITINTGEDNYLTTSDAFEHAHTVLASQFINEQFAKLALMKEKYMGLGHAYEIDPSTENSFLYELSQAFMAREIFPDSPLKYMPPTKHMTGDIFMGTIQNALFNIVSVTSFQSIHLLGMMTEAIHTPFVSDRALALNNANYIEKAFKDFGNEITFKTDGIIQNRAIETLNHAHDLLLTIKEEGMFETLKMGRFAGISRHESGGKGLDGVFKKHNDYVNPILSQLLKRLEVIK
jgi:beta-lysine 5,6-aminomutase alpha subunit